MFRHQHFTLNVRLLHFFTGLSDRSGLEPVWLKLLGEQNLEADEPTNFSLRALESRRLRLPQESARCERQWAYCIFMFRFRLKTNAASSVAIMRSARKKSGWNSGTAVFTVTEVAVDVTTVGVVALSVT